MAFCGCSEGALPLDPVDPGYVDPEDTNPEDLDPVHTNPEPSLRLPAIDEPMPELLSSIGLYPSAPNLDVVARGAFAYTPRFPLWSNGSEKRRFVALPGADAAPEPYPDDFAPGTTFFKTFLFESEEGSKLRPVETRVLRLENEGWNYYRYLWNDKASDAQLLTSLEPQLVTVISHGDEFEHEVPSPLDCKTCHEAGDSPVLGYRQIQLQDTPLSSDPTSITEQIVGYALGNCSHCHNGGDTDAGFLDLRPDAFLESTLDRPTEGGSFPYGLRIASGRPEESLLFLALSGGDESGDVQAMPPLGVQRVDEEAVALFRRWIESL